jgi:hypothetical protein
MANDEGHHGTALTMLNPLRNVALTLQAAGFAAVTCVLFMCVAVVGIFGSGPAADKALSVLELAVKYLVGAYVGIVAAIIILRMVVLTIRELRRRTL